MHGTTPKQPSMLALVSMESLAPPTHLLRAVKQVERARREELLSADHFSYDTRDFVRRCRELRVTPHVAKNEHALSCEQGIQSQALGIR